MQTRSRRYPQINLEGSARKGRQNSNAQRREMAIGGAWQWEVDAFERIANAALADALEVKARTEDVAALRLTLSAEVAHAYFGVIAAHKTLNLLNQQVSTDEELVELLELRFNLGVGAIVEVLQQRSRVIDDSKCRRCHSQTSGVSIKRSWSA